MGRRDQQGIDRDALGVEIQSTRVHVGQRGSFRKEDVPDSVIALRKPPHYRAEPGTRSEIPTNGMAPSTVASNHDRRQAIIAS